MKQPHTFRKSTIFVLAGTACLMLFTGCQSYRNLRLEHAASDGGTLKAVPATKIALGVQDERPMEERDRVAKIKKVTYVVEGGVAKQVESALRSEFEKAGHQVLPAGTSEVPAIIQVGIQRFTAGYRNTGGGFALEKYAEINAEVRLRRGTETQPSKVLPVSVRKSKVYGMAAPGGMAEVVEPAYDEFINNIAKNPELATALKNLQ